MEVGKEFYKVLHGGMDPKLESITIVHIDEESNVYYAYNDYPEWEPSVRESSDLNNYYDMFKDSYSSSVEGAKKLVREEMYKQKRNLLTQLDRVSEKLDLLEAV